MGTDDHERRGSNLASCLGGRVSSPCRCPSRVTRAPHDAIARSPSIANGASDLSDTASPVQSSP
jgi:hypothetical protein